MTKRVSPGQRINGCPGCCAQGWDRPVQLCGTCPALPDGRSDSSPPSAILRLMVSATPTRVGTWMTGVYD